MSQKNVLSRCTENDPENLPTFSVAQIMQTLRLHLIRAWVILSL